MTNGSKKVTGVQQLKLGKDTRDPKLGLREQFALAFGAQPKAER